eukprot:12888203-Prorocentrum_lima.AAC.1
MVAAQPAPTNAATCNNAGPTAAAQHVHTYVAPLTTWSEEVDSGTGGRDVLNNEEAYYSTTEEGDDEWGRS